MPEDTLPRWKTPEDGLKTLHEELHREHNLISNRMSWYVASQAFMMTAFAASGAQGHRFKWLAEWFLPLLGLFISALIVVSVGAAIAAMLKLRCEVDKLLDANVKTLNRGIYGIRAPWINVCGLASPALIPLVIMAFWLIAWCKAS